ncbi:MAG: PaaI family thioesterase [Hyphomicrobiaceae bacterium]
MTEPDNAAGRFPDRLSGFRELVSYRVVAWSRHTASIALMLGPEHLNRMGIVHGGVYMTILDAAMGHAATYAPPGSPRLKCVTVSMSTNFMASTRGGTIIATGQLRSVEGAIAVCEGRVTAEDGTELMLAQGTFKYLS